MPEIFSLNSKRFLSEKILLHKTYVNSFIIIIIIIIYSGLSGKNVEGGLKSPQIEERSFS